MLEIGDTMSEENASEVCGRCRGNGVHVCGSRPHGEGWKHIRGNWEQLCKVCSGSGFVALVDTAAREDASSGAARLRPGTLIRAVDQLAGEEEPR
jgi:DnaJ-class molecular chaperone